MGADKWWTRATRTDVVASLIQVVPSAWQWIGSVVGSAVLGVASFFDSRIGFAIAVGVGFFFVVAPSLAALRKQRVALPPALPPAAPADITATPTPEKCSTEEIVDCLRRLADCQISAASLSIVDEVISRTSINNIRAASLSEEPSVLCAAFADAVNFANTRLGSVRGFEQLQTVAGMAASRAVEDFRRTWSDGEIFATPEDEREYKIAIYQTESINRWLVEMRPEIITGIARKLANLDASPLRRLP